MKSNWRKLSKRVGLGGTLLATLMASAWGEELPDLTLPPTYDEVEYTAALDKNAPPVPEGYEAVPSEPGLVPVVPQPLPEMPFVPEDDVPAEPPKLQKVPFAGRQAEIGSPRETETAIVRSLPADEADAEVEVVHERYADGSVRIEREMKQDAEGNYVLHGAWKYFDPKGNVLAEGSYHNGQRDGQWRRLLRGNDALLISSQPYALFQGPYLSEANFENGKLAGKWTMSDSKQQVIHEIEFHEGLRHGAARWYHPNGKLAHEVPYVHGQLQGEAQLWDANGKLVRSEKYESGRRLGLQANNYPSGVKHVEAECLFAEVKVKTADDWWTATLATYETNGTDERHGRFTVWHPNGAKQREGEYVLGKPIGEMTWWYNNGQKQLSGNYEQGSAVGTWTWWHANGQKSITGTFTAGNPVGEWKWWKEDGKLAQRVDLDDLQGSERAALLKQIPAPVSPLR